MELQYKDFNFVTGGGDLADLSSKAAMESNGWVYHGKKGCGNGNWYGDCGTESWYCTGSEIGSISTKFKGTGLATLDFGNCYKESKKGMVEVFVKSAKSKKWVSKGDANKNEKSKSIKLEFSPGDELKITEKNGGIIKLNSFNVEGEKLNVYFIILSRRNFFNLDFLTTKIVSRSNGIFYFKAEYSTMANMVCSPETTMYLKNVDDAKRECDESGSKCGMFYDACSDGKNFGLCPNGAVQKKSSCGSTLYNKVNLGSM